MSKQHSERLQTMGNTVAEKEDIWAAVMEVWANLPSADVARGFVQAYRVMGKIIEEGGNNHWLKHGGPHLNVRRDFYDTPSGCLPKSKTAGL